MEIKLLNQKIVLRSSETDTDLVQEVVDLVAARLQSAEKRTKTGAASHQVALLALLDLAEEYVKAKRRTLDYKRQVDERSSRLLNLIDAELK